MKAKEVKRLYKAIHRKAFPKVKRPKLYVWPEICAVYIGSRNVIIFIGNSHEYVGDVLETLLHELCHAEQKSDKKQVADNDDHIRRMKAAWKRLL